MNIFILNFKSYYTVPWLPLMLRNTETAGNAGDLGSILGLGRSPGEGNGNPLQYSCLGNFMDRGTWWASWVSKTWTWLSNWDTHTSTYFILSVSSVQSLSLIQLCNPMNCRTPGLPVHHQLLEFTQTHVHRVGDGIQPSHPLSSPSRPAPNPSQHQSHFQWVRSSYEVAKVLEFQL